MERSSEPPRCGGRALKPLARSASLLLPPPQPSPTVLSSNPLRDQSWKTPRFLGLLGRSRRSSGGGKASRSPCRQHGVVVLWRKAALSVFFSCSPGFREVAVQGSWSSGVCHHWSHTAECSSRPGLTHDPRARDSCPFRENPLLVWGKGKQKPT